MENERNSTLDTKLPFMKKFEISGLNTPGTFIL
jgi:hypothetical protein